MDGDQAQTWLDALAFLSPPVTAATSGPALLASNAVPEVVIGAFHLVIAVNLVLLFGRLDHGISRRTALLWFGAAMGGGGVLHLLNAVAGGFTVDGLIHVVRPLTAAACVVTAVSLPFLSASVGRDPATAGEGIWKKVQRWLAPAFRPPPGSHKRPAVSNLVLDKEFETRHARTMEPLQRHVDGLAASRRDSATALQSLVDVAALFRATCSQFTHLAADRRVKFTVSAPEISVAQLDGPKVERVLLNLLFNAFKFTPSGGTIACDLEQNEALGDLTILVSDSGPGVPEGLRSSIFLRSPAAADARDGAHTLLGLGLVASCELIHSQHGTIQVTQGPHGGAHFTVTLPARVPPDLLSVAGSTQLPAPADAPGAIAHNVSQPTSPPALILALDTALNITSLRPDLDSLAAHVQQHQRERQTLVEATQVAKELAERATRVKGNFLRMMSHELRTPITAMRLQIRLLERSANLSATGAQALAGITRSSQRLLDMVDTVLEYARIESGRFESRLELFSLDELSVGVVAELRTHAEHKDISLETETSAALPLVYSDMRLMRLIAVNLVGNAVKFTHSGGVKIRLYVVGGAHCFSVADSSPGLSAELLAEIFEPFNQMDDIRQREGLGSGLGLAIVRELVLALGGTIIAESEVGVGSTFTVMLPQAIQQGALAPERPVELLPGDFQATTAGRPATPAGA